MTFGVTEPDTTAAASPAEATAADAAANPEGDAVRARLVAAAAGLIAAGGVQPPALYRHFGDLRGLLDAVAHETLAGYVREKATRAHTEDPIEDLRRGWDLHVAFGLAHPAVYALLYGDPATTADVRASRPAARDGEAHLHALVVRAAAAGRLRVSVPHAVRLIAAAGNGVTLALTAASPAARDPQLSDAMREAVLAAITVAPSNDCALGGSPDTPGSARTAERVVARAVALRAVLLEAAPHEVPDVLSPAERYLLSEWLDRVADAPGGDARQGRTPGGSG